MDSSRYTHVLLDDDSGEAIGAVRDVDEMLNGAVFGVLRRFDAKDETYIWLEGLNVLRLDEADPLVRNHVAWALKQPQPV